VAKPARQRRGEALMHIAEGVLATPLLVGCTVLSAGGLLFGLRRLDDARMPLAALLGAAFFVASTVHVPVGVGSVHLVLNGLAGLLLGWGVFPLFFVALLLQAALFSFGGFLVLGANLLCMALPAVLCHLLLGPLLRGTPGPRRLFGIGIGCGLIGVGGAAAIASLLLALSGGRLFDQLIGLLLVAHLPVIVVDSLIGALVLGLLWRMSPALLQERRP